ncbi:glutaredoxin domain-containing protein [Arthrobacter crystallopoietes]|uniref:glutaredoxin domain-containing protein n=1 Tax=Crystallibacter crystallopoietes TaxID=37928 RepID=UPI001F1E2BCF|nr:glutaredoxin domain-containing protein [Arthrobacter crystallopoietes]
MKPLLHWSNAIVLAAVAGMMLVVYGSRGEWVQALVVAAILLAAAWFVSPVFGGRQKPWSALRRGQDHEPGVVIFWRPGCVYCIRMMATLGRTRRKAQWVNIWRDAEAAAFVREHNDGNETVPTVILRDGVVTNPDPEAVRRELVRG